MCVIACKYLDGYGWIGIKNRDRNYKPVISVKQSMRDGVESLYILDSVTKYSEGINEYGIGIINSATSVKNDESEIALARRMEKSRAKKDGTYRAPDGVLMRRALRKKNIKDVIQTLIDYQIVGNNLIFNEEECYLLEAGRDESDFKENMRLSEIDPEHEWSKMKYTYDLTKVNKQDFIVRTNHGQFLPWLGYQQNSNDEKQLKSRESSETRHETAIRNLKTAKTPEDMLTAISDLSNKNSQLNPVRIGDYHDKTKLKTTGQIMIIPKKKELIYVPIWCNSDAQNFTKVNSQKTKTFFTLKAFNPMNENLSFKQKYYLDKLNGI